MTNTANEKELIKEAMEVYGITDENILDCQIKNETGPCVIVTHGGVKVTHRKGEKALFQLTESEKTGAISDNKRRWSKRFSQWLTEKEIFG